MNLKHIMANLPVADTPEDQITLASLEARMYSLSQEALSLDGTKDLANKWFTNFTGFLKDSQIYLSRRLKVFLAKPTTLHDNQVLKATRGLNYIQLSPIVLPCLAGFRVTVLEHAEVLHEATKISASINKDLMRHVSLVVGRFINQPDELADASIDVSIDYKSSSDELRERMAESLNGDTTVTSRPFGELYERVTDISAVTTWINEANVMQHATSAKDMTRIVADLSKQIERLQKIIQLRQGKGQAMSPNMAGLLSSLIFSAAREVEFYSITAFNLETFSKITQEGFDALAKMAAR